MGDCWLSILVRTCVSDTSLYPFVETFFFLFVCFYVKLRLRFLERSADYMEIQWTDCLKWVMFR